MPTLQPKTIITLLVTIQRMAIPIDGNRPGYGVDIGFVGDAVVVSNLKEGGPAALSGLLSVMDKIVAINGVRIDSRTPISVISQLLPPDEYTAVFEVAPAEGSDAESRWKGYMNHWSPPDPESSRPNATGAYFVEPRAQYLDGWERWWSDKHQLPFYVNLETGEKQWEAPQLETVEGWEVGWSLRAQAPYWINCTTGVSQWEKPYPPPQLPAD